MQHYNSSITSIYTLQLCTEIWKCGHSSQILACVSDVGAEERDGRCFVTTAIPQEEEVTDDIITYASEEENESELTTCTFEECTSHEGDTGMLQNNHTCSCVHIHTCTCTLFVDF